LSNRTAGYDNPFPTFFLKRERAGRCTTRVLTLAFLLRAFGQMNGGALFTLFRYLPATSMRFPTSRAFFRLRPRRATGCARAEFMPRHVGEPSRTLPLHAARRPI
jgi:hypothetical protein